MFRKILVPLDGSTLAEHALPPAASLAEGGDGALLFLRVPVFRELSVVGIPGYGWMPPTPSVMKGPHKEADNYLATLVADRAYADMPIETMVVDGDVASVIVDTAGEKAVDLIVMTTHGRSGIGRWALGSVTIRVLEEAPCPVLVVRPGQTISRILIPLDGSALSESVIEPALAVADVFSARVVLLHVKSEPSLTMPEQVDEETQARLEAALHPQQYLSTIVERYHDAPVALAPVVLEGSPEFQILAYAEKHGVDCIAMATHGYSGMRRWLFGSTTRKVLDHTPCDMLIVRPREEKEA